MGQEQTLRHAYVMSALPMKADITKRGWHVCFVPKTDISSSVERAAKNDDALYAIHLRAS
jgi:hypothetical protein